MTTKYFPRKYIYGRDSQCNPDRQNTMHCAGRYLDSIEERWKKMALRKPTFHHQWIVHLIDISHLYWFSEFGDILPQHCQIYWKCFWFLASNILKMSCRSTTTADSWHQIFWKPAAEEKKCVLPRPKKGDGEALGIKSQNIVFRNPLSDI